MSSAAPLINIYLCTMFNFNPVCTFQDITRTGNTYEKWLWGDNTINIQGRTMVLVHSTASHCKHFFMDNPGPVAFENGQALIFFRQAEKIHFTKSPHIKALLVNKL